MITFYAVAAIMIAVALALVLVPLLRRRRDPAAEDARLNVALARDRLAELKAEYEQGLMDREAYQSAHDELAARVLRESEVSQRGSHRAPLWLPIILLVALPVGALGLYAGIGSPGLIIPDPQQQQAERGRAILAERAAQLEERLQEQPRNVDGWARLGEIHALLRQWQQARDAYARAYDIAGEQRPDVMVDYAEMLVATAGDQFDPQALSILERALELDPGNQKGRWLLGLARFQAGQYQGAVQVWEQLRSEVPADSRQAELLGQFLQQARARTGQGEPVAPEGRDAGKALVTVNVQLAEALHEQLDPDATLFIFAQATEGPPMPLAAVKRSASALPLRVRLTDADAMMGNRKLSQFDEVRVVARVSRDGEPRANAGDLEGSAVAATDGGEAVTVTIDQVVE